MSRLLCSHLTTPAALTTHQTSHQYIHHFLPFRRKKSGSAPDVWHFILHSASPSSSLSFSVFLLHLTNLFCSLCFCTRLLPLTPPSHSSFLFSFTLALLPSQPEVNRDPLLRLARHPLMLSKTPLGSKSWSAENSCTLWWLFCTCHLDLTTWTHRHILPAFSVSLEKRSSAFMGCAVESSLWFYWFLW